MRGRRATLIWLVLLSVVLRCPGLLRPLTGNFATKHVVYAMIARNWALGRASLWYPTLDVIEGHDRSLHMLEFPVSAYLTGFAWSLLGGSLDVWGRLTAVSFTALSVALLCLLACRWHGETVALVASLIYALSPISIIYGQSFMLEPSLVSFLLGAMLTLDIWLETHRGVWLATAGVSLALLLLTKIYMLVALLPLLAITWRRGSLATYATLMAATIPALLWFAHVLQTSDPGNPLAERLYYSLGQSAEVHRFPHPLLLSADFYIGIAKDLGTVVLTPLGVLLAGVGLYQRAARRHRPWLLACVALILALPLKFHEMNYYFLAVLPLFCVASGLGWDAIATRWPVPRWAAATLLALGVVCCLRYSVRPAFITPGEDISVAQAGAAARQHLGEDQAVVTMHGSTIDLLYYCNHRGWAVSPHQDANALADRLAECRRHGARCLVVAGSEQFSRCPASWELINTFALVARGNDYWIFEIPTDVSVVATRSPAGGTPEGGNPPCLTNPLVPRG